MRASSRLQDNRDNPCLICGACCAYYRTSFYWAEADDAGGTVPAELTERLDFHRLAMKGTNQARPRCIALEGEIGICVKCRIYELRPNVCREFEYSWQNGRANERCDKARAAWGLPPLRPATKPKPSDHWPRAA